MSSKQGQMLKGNDSDFNNDKFLNSMKGNQWTDWFFSVFLSSSFYSIL